MEAARVREAGESEPSSITRGAKRLGNWTRETGGMEWRKRETESVEINKGTIAVSDNNVTFFSNCVLIVLMFPRSVGIDYPYAAGPIGKICEWSSWEKDRRRSWKFRIAQGSPRNSPINFLIALPRIFHFLLPFPSCSSLVISVKAESSRND